MAPRSASIRRRPRWRRWLLPWFVLGAVGWWAWQRWLRPASTEAPPKPGVTNSAVHATPAGKAPAVIPPVPSTNRPAAAPPEANVPAPAPLRPPPIFHPQPETPSTVPAATDLLAVQIALAAQGISCGSLDGVGGTQTAAALRAFQMQHGLEQTGWLDRDTRRELTNDRASLTNYIISTADLARLAPLPATWLGKSQAAALDFETVLELVAERSHAHPNLIRRLNPSVNWSAVSAGTEVVVPNAAYPPARRANLVRVSLGQRWIRAFDARGNLLAHFPCSIGRIAEKRPVGELHVTVAVKDPNYTFDPAVFPESAEARATGRRLVIPPGPNNPVGVAWIGLDRPGYGIHGTPGPEQVGRTESHGCFRLANWNAEYLRQMVSVGTPVWIEP
jgi:lipoprotein-anchoring transpeptidase ErfK/SrfK